MDNAKNKLMKNYGGLTMKKFTAVILALIVTVSFAACGKKADTATTTENTTVEQTTATQTNNIADALALLTTVWNSYAEDDKFPVSGGDSSAPVMNAPAKFSISDAAALNSTLGLPESSAAKIDDAASLVHMMNANTFTCGAFHAANSSDAADLATAIKENTMARQWMCGFPDKLVVVTIDDYVVSFFGAEDLTSTFKDKLVSAYPDAAVVCDQAVI